MSFQALVEALQSVPYLNALGITVEEARPGSATLRLPARESNLDHAGNLHTGALFSLGEAASAVAVGTTARLAEVMHLQKACGIKYLAHCRTDVTARASLPPEVVDGILKQLEERERTQAAVVVEVLDGYGNDIAEIVAIYTFRRRA